MRRPEPRSRAPRRPWRRGLTAATWGVCLAVAGFAGCSGWDPRSPFERNAPDVDEAVRALDAGKPEPAEDLLERYLGTGPCSADGGIGVSPAVRQKAGGSFDLGLTLFNLGERFGRRFGDEEVDGGAPDEAREARRIAEIDCALLVVRAIAADTKVPTELRARARYLAGNLEFMRRKYEDAVKEYDQALALVPGLSEETGADGLGRDASWNRAIALRRIQDQKDAGQDAPDAADDASDANDGSDAADGSDGHDGADGSDGNDSGPDAGDGGDGGGDKPDGGGKDGGEDGGKDDAGADGGDQDGGQQPQPQPPQPASPQQQDDRMLDQLEQAPSYQEQEARKRAHQRHGRQTMEDK